MFSGSLPLKYQQLGRLVIHNASSLDIYVLVINGTFAYAAWGVEFID